MTLRDPVDDVIEAWRRERPDLDLTAVALAGRIGRTANRLAPAQQTVFTTHGLQAGEFDVLATLRRAGAPYELTPTSLAATLLLSKGGMTARVDRLVDAGLVDRRLDDSNRRSFRVSLTERGFAVVDAAMTDHTDNVDKLMNGLTDTQQSQLNALLRKLLASLDDG